MMLSSLVLQSVLQTEFVVSCCYRVVGLLANSLQCKPYTLDLHSRLLAGGSNRFPHPALLSCRILTPSQLFEIFSEPAKVVHVVLHVVLHHVVHDVSSKIGRLFSVNRVIGCRLQLNLKETKREVHSISLIDSRIGLLFVIIQKAGPINEKIVCYQSPDWSIRLNFQSLKFKVCERELYSYTVRKGSVSKPYRSF